MRLREPITIQFQPILDRPYHDRRYYIDFSKIHNELGWSCTIPFEEGLSKTLEYYIQEYDLSQMKSIISQRPQG